jgi:hypothetical protein
MNLINSHTVTFFSSQIPSLQHRYGFLFAFFDHIQNFCRPMYMARILLNTLKKVLFQEQQFYIWISVSKFIVLVLHQCDKIVEINNLKGGKLYLAHDATGFFPSLVGMGALGVWWLSTSRRKHVAKEVCLPCASREAKKVRGRGHSPSIPFKGMLQMI